MINRLVKTLIKLTLVMAILVPVSSLTSPLMISNAVAQELSPDHLALAKRYVELTDRAQIYEIMLIETGISTMRAILRTNPEISQPVSDSIGVVIAHYSDRKDELFDQFARIYALRFTASELREILDFYETDVGEKLASQNQAINTELQTVLSIFQTNLNTEFFAKVRAELRDLEIEI